MQPETKRIIVEELRNLIQERTRDQFGRAWAHDAATAVAGDVALSIEKRIANVDEMTVTRDVQDQSIHAKLQHAWWDSFKVAEKESNPQAGWSFFVRKMNAAFVRQLF